MTDTSSVVARPAAGSAPDGSAPAMSGEEDADVPIASRNPTWGSRTALVTIVEFADLECPFCSRAEATLARVREAFGPETVRIVWKNSPLPFHANARPAAEAAMGVFALAGADAFWKFYGVALESRSALGPLAYEQWAAAAGVSDMAAFRAGIDRHAWASSVDQDLAEARALGVFGTPTFFVNGLPLAGALPFPTFQVLINEQVQLAQAKLAAGTPRERLYAELTRENRAKNASEEEPDDEAADAKTVYKIPIGASPARGGRDALVTVIEFADYECPYCAQAEQTLRSLRDAYGDKLRIVFKDNPLPFHDRAEPAAQAALEVRAEKGDAAFWGMHDALFAGPKDLSDGTLAELAGRFGARPPAVLAAIAAHTHRKLIEGDADLAEDFEANGTPYFFINGRRLEGAQPKERFESLIDEEMSRARGLLTAGTKPDELYEALVRDGKGAPPPERKQVPASLPASDPARGPAAAKVVIHEWSDFQCPFCKRAEPTLAEVMRTYGARVRLVWHDLPLPMHAEAPLAARAAREALAQQGDRGFWAMHDAIFGQQEQLGRATLDAEARALGLDMGRWARALDGEAHAGDVDADGRAAASIDIAGTPAFVIVAAGSREGYYLSGAQAYSRFRRLIDRALAEAK